MFAGQRRLCLFLGGTTHEDGHDALQQVATAERDPRDQSSGLPVVKRVYSAFTPRIGKTNNKS